MEMIVLGMLACLLAYIGISIVTVVRKKDIATIEYFLSSDGFGKIVIIVFMSFTVAFFAMNMDIRTTPATQNIGESLSLDQAAVIERLDKLIEINENIQVSHSEASNESKELKFWVVIALILIVVLALIWWLRNFYKNTKDDGVRKTIIWTGGIASIIGTLSITLLQVSITTDKLIEFRDEHFYFELDKGADKISSVPKALFRIAPTKIDFLGSIKPFAEAKDVLESSDANSSGTVNKDEIRRQLIRLLKTEVKEDRTIGNVIFIGIFDKNPLSAGAKEDWENNFDLAEARAQKVQSVFESLLTEEEFVRHAKARFNVLAYGPGNTDYGIDQQTLAQDRRVDIYVGSHRTIKPK